LVLRKSALHGRRSHSHARPIDNGEEISCFDLRSLSEHVDDVRYRLRPKKGLFELKQVSLLPPMLGLHQRMREDFRVRVRFAWVTWNVSRTSLRTRAASACSCLSSSLESWMTLPKRPDGVVALPESISKAGKSAISRIDNVCPSHLFKCFRNQPATAQWSGEPVGVTALWNAQAALGQASCGADDLHNALEAVLAG
jgi:hypothetical protein